MDHYKLVLPAHINHYGFLFGGYLLQWLDEFAYITATVEFPGLRFVTVAMKDVQFQRRILTGEVLRFSVRRIALGRTSVQYLVQAYGLVMTGDPGAVLFETTITFVSVDADGRKQPIPRPAGETGGAG
ncbi:MAG: acyl-CoA thioesterase [Chromatiales bacterium]|jgi:acyl-CoA hydrolase|nr:acyl-CoA thioesterase [Chromatiales bacterium]